MRANYTLSLGRAKEPENSPNRILANCPGREWERAGRRTTFIPAKEAVIFICHQAHRPYGPQESNKHAVREWSLQKRKQVIAAKDLALFVSANLRRLKGR